MSIENDATHVCLFGGPKAGKTELAGRLSEYFNLHWIDCEKGYATLMKLPSDWKKRISIYALPDTRDYPIAAETCLKLVKGGKHVICRAHGKISCPTCTKSGAATDTLDLDSLGPNDIVVWDSGTQIAQSVLNNITKEHKNDDYKPTWDDYRAQGHAMNKFLGYLQVAKYNTVFITHEAETELDDGSKKLVPIAGTLNFSRNTAKYFDHVIYSRVVNRKHSFASSSTYSNSVVTGSRTDVVLENDSTPTLLRAFKPSLFKESDAKEKLEKIKERISK